MTLSFASATGNLFNRLGRLGKVISQLRSYQSSQTTNLAANSSVSIVGQYAAEPDLQAVVGGSYINLLNAPGSIGSAMQNMARLTASRMVFRDNPRLFQNLQSVNITDSLVEIIRQMRAQGASVLAHTITATPATFAANGGVGNGVVTCSVKRPADGLVLENTFAESVLATCLSDSYIGGALLNNETFAITGTGRQTNVFAFDWPLGSDGRITVNAIDADSDNASGNILTNSGYEEFTSNTPDNWTIEVGTAGTHVFEESTLVFGGSGAVCITGDGATLVQFYQEFEDGDDGTSGELEPLTQYSFNVWMRRDGIAPAAGVLAVELVDGSGAVIND